MFLAKDLDAEQPDRIVFDASCAERVNREDVGVAIDRLDAAVAAPGKRELFAAANEANYLALLVIVGQCSLHARKVAIYEDALLAAVSIDMTSCDERRADRLVQFAPFVVRRTYHLNALTRFMCGDVFSGDCLAALRNIGDFANVPATLKNRERLHYLSPGRVCDRLAKLGIPLATDSIEPGNRHPCLLHLINRTSGFDRVMLPLVADEDHAGHAFIARLVKQAIDLARRKQARFVDNPDFPLVRRC